MRWTVRRAVRGVLATMLIASLPACTDGRSSGAETVTTHGAPTGAGGDGTSSSAGPSGPVSSSSDATPDKADASRMALRVGTPAGDPVRAVPAEGPVTTDVVTRDGGRLVAALDPWGRPVLRFPAFSSAPAPPRAVVVVVPQAEENGPLSPGTAAFSFGADFALDPVSEGTEVDNGDNLMQRGLASDPSQFKIDVDDGRPSCRVQGSQGVAVVRLPERVEPDTWYRVRCSRSADSVRLQLDQVVGEDATVQVADAVVEVATGDLGWRPGTPLSVGGKVGATGEILRSSTDQFNGWVTRPLVELTE